MGFNGGIYKNIKTMRYILFILLIFPLLGFSQTIQINGKQYLPDTLATNSNFIIVRYEALPDTLAIKEKIKEVDEERERIINEIAELQKRLSEMDKQKSKYNDVLIIEKEKEKEKDKVEIQMIEPKRKTIFKKIK